MPPPHPASSDATRHERGGGSFIPFGAGDGRGGGGSELPAFRLGPGTGDGRPARSGTPTGGLRSRPVLHDVVPTASDTLRAPTRSRTAAPPSAIDVARALDAQRERIGQDLHDGVGSLLTGIRLLSERLAACPTLSDGPDGAGETARRIAAYAAEALGQVQSISRDLVPPPSGEAVEALRPLVERADALGPTRCVFRQTEGAGVLDPAVGVHIYRIVQEAVSNALRHASASALWVTLDRDGDDVIVEVEDNGIGFDTAAPSKGSVGLRSMAARARAARGVLHIESQPGQGTTVRVTVPA